MLWLLAIFVGCIGLGVSAQLSELRRRQQQLEAHVYRSLTQINVNFQTIAHHANSGKGPYLVLPWQRLGPDRPA